MSFYSLRPFILRKIDKLLMLPASLYVCLAAWDTVTKQQLNVYKGHKNWVHTVDFLQMALNLSAVPPIQQSRFVHGTNSIAPSFIGAVLLVHASYGSKRRVMHLH